MKKIALILLLATVAVSTFALYTYSQNDGSETDEDIYIYPKPTFESTFDLEVPNVTQSANSEIYVDADSGFEMTLSEGWGEVNEKVIVEEGSRKVKELEWEQGEYTIELRVSIDETINNTSGGLLTGYGLKQFKDNYISIEHPTIDMWISQNTYSYFDTTETVYGEEGDTTTILFDVILDNQMKGEFKRSLDQDSFSIYINISNSVITDTSALQDVVSILRSIKLPEGG